MFYMYLAVPAVAVAAKGTSGAMGGMPATGSRFLFLICVQETRLAGRTLPAGSMVVFSPYILHRRPDLYPHAHRFDPGRWLAPAAHRAAFLRFGAGATKCIGEEFGLAEATLILASVTARWNLSPEAGTTVSPAARTVLVPRAFPVRLSGRGPSGGEAPDG